CSRVSGGIPPRQGVQVLLARASVMLLAPRVNLRPRQGWQTANLLVSNSETRYSVFQNKPGMKLSAYSSPGTQEEASIGLLVDELTNRCAKEGEVSTIE